MTGRKPGAHENVALSGISSTGPAPRLAAVSVSPTRPATAAPDAQAGPLVARLAGVWVAGPERLRDAARRLVAAADEGRGVVAVVDGMAGAAEDLHGLAHAVSPSPRPRELDLLVSVGARQASALCAMAIIDLGRGAISLTGSQAGVVTDVAHGEARLVEVRPERIERALAEGAIVLVAGYQGVSTEHEVTTLGPGGADATAAALALALGGEARVLGGDDFAPPAHILPLPSGRG